MDTIEAINTLANFKRYISGGGVVDRKANEAINMAIRALEVTADHDTASRQAEPQTNCEYCHEDSDGYVKPIDKNSHAFVRFGMDGWELSLKANGWHGEARIKFCPMCGRRLADE